MWMMDYDPTGPDIDHTWEIPVQKVTWDGCATYMDEAHLVIDSLDTWRKRAGGNVRAGLGDVIDAVNAVSSIKVQA